MGVVRASATNQLTTGKINLGGMTAALELSGGTSLANAVDLTSTGDWANITGIDSLGAIRSTSGVNVITGQLTLVNPVGGANNVNRYYGVGADLGAALTLGAVRTDMTTTDNRNVFLYLLGKGTINIAGDFDNTNATGTDRFHVNQVDDNIVNVSAANAFADNHYRIYRGVTNVIGAGTLGNSPRSVIVFQDGKLVLDNSTTNTMNRLGIASRVLDMRAGVLELIPNAAAVVTQALTGGSTVNASTTVTVANTAGLQAGMVVTGANIPAGATIVSITDGTKFVISAAATAAASSQAFSATTQTTHATSAAFSLQTGGSTIIMGGGGQQRLTFASLGTNAAGTLNITGTFGTATNRITFAATPTLVNGLIPRLTVNGDNFATYDATNGIIGYTGYSSAQNILSASGTATYQATRLKANSLTGAQTISALALTSEASQVLSVGGLGGLNPATLTISSGAILANGTGTGSTLAVPIVAFGSEAIFHVASGQAVTVTSAMTGTAGLTKALPGSLFVESPQFISGNTTVNAGTLRLAAGATNTLWYGSSLGVNNGATFDLNGGAQYLTNLYSNDGDSRTNARGGAIVNTAGTQATLAFNTNSAYNGSIAGDIALVKVGTNTISFNFPTSYTGPTFVIGNLNVADSGAILGTSSFDISRGRLMSVNDTGSLYYVANRFSDSAPITMRASEILLSGRVSTDVTERFGAVTLIEGTNQININNGGGGVNSGNILLTSLSRSAGSAATLRFNNLGGFGQPNAVSVKIDTPPTLTNGIIGPWAVVDRAFATYDAVAGVAGLGVSGVSGYSGEGLLSGPLATNNVVVRDTATVTLLENVSVNTLNFTPGGSGTIDLGGFKLTLAGGGLISGQDGDNRTNTFQNGTITSGLAGGDLYFHILSYGGTNRPTNFNAVFADNGAQAVRLITAAGDGGTSVLNLNGVNTNTGGTVFNRGTINLGAGAALGSGGLELVQATLNQTLGGVIPVQSLTMGGGSTLTLANQPNTFTSITVRNNGGGATLNLTGTTTLSGGLTVESRDPSALPSLANGILDLAGQASAAFVIGSHIANGVSLAPLQPSLNIVSVIQNGGISKSGNGVLQLSGANTFAGGVNVTAGGLAIGANSNPLSGVVASGPLGTAAFTMGANTRLITTGTWTVGNAVTFQGDTLFASTSTSASALTLNGVATLPSIWNVTVLNPLLTVSLADASPSISSDVINKSGFGTLNIGNYAGTILVAGGLSITADGNGRGTFQELAIGGDITITGDTAITVNRTGSGPFSRNKIIQKGALSITGNIMSVTNLAGYGLEVTGTTTMSGPAHFSVGTASNWLQNSGLILTGVIDDGVTDFGLIKSGPGTLELRGVNTFGGAGKTIDILGGVLAANSDAALGSIDNSVTLNADGLLAVGFRATDSFTTGRSFILNQTNNAFEVTRDKVLTLTTPFALAGNANRALGKSYAGVLALTANNTGWTGPITVTGGILRLGHNNAAGSGTITTSPNNWRGTGVELFNNVTVSNSISLQGGDNVLNGGIDSSGQLSSFSGDNTYAGLITYAFQASLGARSGSTLRIAGGISNITTARTLGFNADLGGTIVLNSPITAGSGAATLDAVVKLGKGTLSLTSPQTFGLASGQWFNIRGGDVVLSGGSVAGATLTAPTGASGQTTITLGGGETITGLGLVPGLFVAGTGVPTRAVITSVNTTNNTFTVSANLTAALSTNLKFLTGGTLAAPTYLDQGNRLVLDNRSVAVSGTDNITANGRLGSSSVDARDIVFRGGELYIRGNSTIGDGITEWVNRGLFRRGASTITLEMNNSNRLRLVFAALSDNAVSPAQNANPGPQGTSMLFRGDKFGVSNDPGNSAVVFAGGVTFIGRGERGLGGTTHGILPWAVVGRTDQVGNEQGYSFATVTEERGGGNQDSGDRYIRPLGATEYSAANIATGLDNNNLLFNANSNTTIGSNFTPNSLTIEAGADIALADGVRLALASGGILVRNGSTSVISGGVLNQVNTSAPLNIWTIGTAQLTINSAMNGGNGTSNGAISLVKAGAGTLIINPPTSSIVGLTTIGTNSLSGQFVLNEGTVRLGAGLTNAIQSNNFASLAGGTLDLNGGSQFFYGVFADQDYNANNTVVMNSAANTAHFLYNNDNTARNWAGSIQGDIKFTRSGTQTTNFYAAQTYTGSTVINGGNVLLRDDGRIINTPSVEINYGGLYFENGDIISLNDRLNDAAPITMRGGVLEFRGRQQANSSELVGVVSLVASNSFINVTGSAVAGSSAQLDLTRLNRAVGGGTVNFTGAAGLIGTSTRVVVRNFNGVDLSNPLLPNAGLTGGILGGWAIVGSEHFATSIPGLGVAALGTDGFPTYSNLTSAANTIALAAPTDNVNIASAVGNIPVDVNTTLNSLRMGFATSNNVNIAAGKTLTLTSGGLLFFSTDSQTVGSVNSQGTLTSGGPELFVYTQGAGDQRIRSMIADGAQPVAFVKSGANTLRVSGANSYTGGTFVNQGTVHVEGTSNIPAATDPLKGLVVSGATVNIFTPGLIAAANYATISGQGTLNYIGNNTQYGVVLDNVGSSGNPTIRTFNTLNADGTGSKGVLTIGAGGITATSANVGTVSIIEGRISFGATGGTMSVGAIDVNGVADVDPLRATLQLQSIVSTSGAMNKSGAGVLQLNAQALFTGDFNVLAGGLRNGVFNAGSRFADLTISSGARYDLGGQTTTWGSLAGSGDVFSASGTPTLNVGYNNSDATFSGRLMRFNDAAYPLLTKVGTGTLTMNSAQDATGAWSTIRVEGGRLLYSGSGKAFPATVASAASVFSVDDGAVLELSNLTTTVNHRLGLNLAGSLEQRGGTFILGGSASSAVTERITTVSQQFGSGRIELRPDVAQSLLLDVGTLSAGNGHSTMLFAGLTGGAEGNGIANLRIGTINYIVTNGAQGLGTNGMTNRSIRGDILADDSASGKGDGFLVRDVVAIPGITTTNHTVGNYVMSLTSSAGITLGANVTGLGFTGNWTVASVVGNDVTLTGGTAIAPGTNLTVNFSNYWRALAANELNTTPLGALGDGVGGWVAGQNAGVSSAITLKADTVVNSLTFSGTPSVGSGLGSSFGAFGPGGRILNLQLQGATSFLVKDGTTTYTAGALTSGNGTTMFGHVLFGATLNFNAGSAFGLGASGGFVKGGDGLLNLNAPTYFGATASFAVNQGRVNLNSGAANTLAVLADTSGGQGTTLRIEGLNAIVDLSNQAQMVNELRSSSEKPNQAGTLTNSGASFVNFTTYGNSAFAGAITGKVNLVRAGNTSTFLTSASSYTGLTVVRGGNLVLRDEGALTGTSAIQVHNGTLRLDNYGLNAVENPTRLNPATPITLVGGEFRIDGAGSSDIAVRVNSLTAGAGRNTINVLPYVNMGGTIRLDVGNLVLTAGARQSLVINGWTGNNSGGYNSLGNQSLAGSAAVIIEKINGATGPANYNFTSVGINTNRILTVASTAGLTAGLAVSGTNIPAGATISSIVSATQIQISLAPTANSAAGTLRATNLTNNLIGGWAVANGSTFATYDSQYGVMEMGYSSGGFTGLGFDAGAFSDATVATGNYNDGSSRTIAGAKVANSWKMGPGAAQDLTFSAGATLTLGVGMITNGGFLIRHLATDATNTITAATGNDLYVFLNQNAMEIEPKLTGTMALISSGGATLRLKPKFASNDYTGGTFITSGVLTLDGTGSAAPFSLTGGATTAASPNVTVTNTTGLLAGMVVNGPGIPAGTTIASITNGTTLVLSAAATATATAQTFAAFGFSGGTTSGSADLTVASTTGLLVGMQVTGAGIPAGTRIASITNATTVVLSAPATATAAAQIYAAALVALPGDVTVHNATLNMSTDVAKAGQVSANSNVTIKGHGRFLLPDFTNMVAGSNIVTRLGSVTFITDGAQGSNPDFALGNPNDVAAFSVLALSGTNAITSTNQTVARVPTVYTGDAPRTRLVFDNAAPVITVNAGEGLVGLNLNAPITQGTHASVLAGGFVNMTSLTKMGAGTVAMIHADSNFTANFILAQGGLLLGSSSVVDVLNVLLNGPIGTGALVIEGGTTLQSDGTVRTLHNAVTVNGDFTFAGQLGGAGVTLAGPITLGAVGRTIAIPSLAVTANFNGALTTTVAAGSTGLTKTGNGTLQFGNASVLNFGGAGLTIAGGVIKAGKANNIPADSLLTVNAGAGYDLMGLPQISNAIAGAGFITNSANAPATLTLNPSADFAFAGVIADNRANVLTSVSETNLVKQGTSVITLTGANTYVGTTTLSAGKIIVANGGSLGTGGVDVAGASILEYARTDTYSLANTFVGTGELNFTGIGGVAKIIGTSAATAGLNVGLTAGTLQFGDNGATGSLDGLASLTISTGATLKFARSNTYDFSTAITSSAANAGVIVQAGTGTTTLSGTNTSFTGDVSITAGELEAAANGALESARQIVIGSAGSFRVSADDALGFGPGPDVILNGGFMRLLASGAVLSNFAAVHDLTLNGGTVLSGTSASGNVNSLFVTGTVFVTNDTTISAKNVGFVQGGSSSNTGFATDITVNPGKTLTLSGTIADEQAGLVSSFNKKGTGTMVLSGDNAGMSGQVTVTAGTVVANHANAFGDGTLNATSGFTAAATINTGARVTSNTAAFSVAAPIAANITVNSGGSLGVGSTIGNFAATSLTLKRGAQIEFKIWDVTLGTGVGYDRLDLGAIDLSDATSANRIKIVLKSMNTATTFGSAVLNLPTAPANFGTFDFGTYDHLNSPPVSGNISDLFTFDTSQFTYTGGTASDAGLWMINFNNTTGAITLTAVPEPSTYGFGLGALALAAAAIRRRRQTKKA